MYIPNMYKLVTQCWVFDCLCIISISAEASLNQRKRAPFVRISGYVLQFMCLQKVGAEQGRVVAKGKIYVSVHEVRGQENVQEQKIGSSCKDMLNKGEGKTTEFQNWTFEHS